MQWLIDIVKEWIIAQGYLTAGYVERPTGKTDFELGDFTTDDTWHELDLSNLVPAGAKGVHLHVRGSTTTVQAIFRLRRLEQGWTKTFCILRTQVADLSVCAHAIVAVDSARKIQYKAEDVVWTLLILTVKGWWY